MATTPKTLTYQEWLALPVSQDQREEVVNGEIRLMPPNKLWHTYIAQKLAIEFVAQLDKNKVAVLFCNFGLVIRKEPLTCRVPDVALFLKDHMVVEDGYVHSAPQLAIEVLSPSDTRRERQEKLSDYESLGVPEVWLVSPEAQSIQVLLLQGGRLRTSTILVEGQLHPQHFPEAAIEVSSIWPD